MSGNVGFMQKKNSKWYAIWLLLTDLQIYYVYIYATSIHSTKKQKIWFIGLFLYDASICDRKVPHSIRKWTERWPDIRREVTVHSIEVHVLRRLLVHDSAQIEVLYRGENERRFLAFKPVVLPFSSLQMTQYTLPHRMHCYSLRTNCSNRRLLSLRSWVGQKKARTPWGTCRNHPMIWRPPMAHCRV